MSPLRGYGLFGGRGFYKDAAPNGAWAWEDGDFSKDGVSDGVGVLDGCQHAPSGCRTVLLCPLTLSPVRGDIFVETATKRSSQAPQERHIPRMANTYTQIYLHVVFAVEGRQNLIDLQHNDEFHVVAQESGLGGVLGAGGWLDDEVVRARHGRGG